MKGVKVGKNNTYVYIYLRHIHTGGKELLYISGVQVIFLLPFSAV